MPPPPHLASTAAADAVTTAAAAPVSASASAAAPALSAAVAAAPRPTSFALLAGIVVGVAGSHRLMTLLGCPLPRVLQFFKRRRRPSCPAYSRRNVDAAAGRRARDATSGQREATPRAVLIP